MNIQGFQKLTLLDFPEAVACIVFTGGCNLRCPFCHNSGLVRSPLELPNAEAEVLEYLAGRKGILNGVCISGGEPLLQGDLAVFAKKVKEMGYRVKLDTNGSLPKRLEEILATGLIDYVAMDIKSAPEKYAAVCGNSHVLPAVEESVAFLQRRPVEFEFRTTVASTLHEIEDFAAIGRWIGPVERYFLQPFADSGDILSGNAADYAVSDGFVQACLAEVRKFVPQAALRGR